MTSKQRVGALAIAAALGLATVGCDSGQGEETSAPPSGSSTGNPAAGAEQVATGFLEAYGAFDADRAIAYLADDASLSELIVSLGAQEVNGTRDELRLFISMLEALRYEQLLDSCEGTGSSATDAVVVCAFDFHLFGSDELGLGPFGGSSLSLTVRDGEIVRASADWGIDEFSHQVWEPFADWVSEAYPDDAAAMYTDDSYSGVRLTEESIRLWEQHVPEYAEEMA